MPVTFGLAELQARKRALVESSEAQRQLLVDEFHNLQLSAAVFQRRLKLISTIASGMALVLPLVRSIFRSRIVPLQPAPKLPVKWSLLGKALTGWRLYRKVAPALQSLIARRF